jgi:hypothetical protein
MVGSEREMRDRDMRPTACAKIAGGAVQVFPPSPGDFAHPTTLRFDAIEI